MASDVKHRSCLAGDVRHITSTARSSENATQACPPAPMQPSALMHETLWLLHAKQSNDTGKTSKRGKGRGSAPTLTPQANGPDAAAGDKNLVQEVAKNQAALDMSTAFRQKELAEFKVEEKVVLYFIGDSDDTADDDDDDDDEQADHQGEIMS